MDGIGGIGGMMAGLQQAIDAAMRKQQADALKDAGAPAADVKVYEQQTRKAASHIAAHATDIGTLVKDKTRINAFSVLGKNDPVDFYKVKLTGAGPLTLGRVGDEGVRVQLMDRAGTILADSNPGAGKAHDAYKQWTEGGLAVERGDYTIRVAREKGVPLSDEKKYALQLRMGGYTEDYDTYAKQAAAGDGTVPSYARTLQALLGERGGGGGPPSLALLSGAARGRGSLINGLF